MKRTTYGKRLKELREEFDLKQNTLNDLLGFKYNCYGQFEREDSFLTIKNLNTLCSYFDISFDYIFEFTDLKQYLNSKKNLNPELLKIRLKEVRNDLEISQLNVAEDLYIGNGTIANYERGSNFISTPILYDFCKKYNISADYLLGRSDSPKYLN